MASSEAKTPSVGTPSTPKPRPSRLIVVRGPREYGLPDRNESSGSPGGSSSGGSWSVDSGVVKVNLLRNRKEIVLTESVHIPGPPAVHATLASIHTPPTTTASRGGQTLAAASNILKPQKPSVGVRPSTAKGPPFLPELRLELLDSSVSPLIQRRPRMEPIINMVEVPFPLAHNEALFAAPPPMRQPEPRTERTDDGGFTALFQKDLSESSWAPHVTDAEGTMTLLMAEQLDRLPHQHDHQQDSMSISASQVQPSPVPRQNSHSRLLSTLREDSGWQYRVEGQLTPLEKLKRAGRGQPTPFTQAAMLRRSKEAPEPVTRLFSRTNV
eukprot:Protomagalhaensia_sp_Gyna_25__5261@NODE_647_length_2918_cov_14_548454_g504_i0_p2_GENE_NODE_647_length_2918_cov_14_548454_g504_i0NODE_647_length_2918_cov_14_548454_g504_i0_p2_ORF_typecomplete_len372_score60_12_NODE_647_length_2918_cov_14_548454_g504_i01401117